MIIIKKSNKAHVHSFILKYYDNFAVNVSYNDDMIKVFNFANRNYSTLKNSAHDTVIMLFDE